MNKLRVLVWGENVHERTNPRVAQIYPAGLHGAIAEGLRASGDDLVVETEDAAQLLTKLAQPPTARLGEALPHRTLLATTSDTE